MVPGILAQAGKELLVGVGHPLWRAPQPFAVGVLADGDEDLAHRRLDPLLVELRLRAHRGLRPFALERVRRTPTASSIAPRTGASGLRMVTVTRVTGGK